MLDSGETGERIAESRSLLGARARLRLPKLPKEELGDDLMDGVDDEVGDVMVLVDGVLAEDRWRGLWLKMVCRCRRTFEEAMWWLWDRRVLEVGLTEDSSWRVSKRETNCDTAMTS
jgi:hypothetical protein